jgi:FkbM family methyltransferase
MQGRNLIKLPPCSAAIALPVMRGLKAMGWHEPWRLRIRRKIWKLLVRFRRHYYVAQHRGASFLVAPHGLSAIEVAAKTWEEPELDYLVERFAELKPEVLIDVGANLGLYSCTLLKNNNVPRAILFEPDRHNRIQLRANLLINGLLDRAEVHEVAVGDSNSRFRLLPGHIVRSDYGPKADGGFSMIVEDDSHGDAAYEVDVVRLDDRVALSGRTLAIKIDVEHYECKALAGMERTLRQNRCIVLVESYEKRDEVMRIMTAFGYELVKDLMPNFVFENRGLKG